MTYGRREPNRQGENNLKKFRLRVPGDLGERGGEGGRGPRPPRPGGRQDRRREGGHGRRRWRRGGCVRPAGSEALSPDAAPHRLEGAAGEGVTARHHFVEDHRQRPDIVGFLGPAAGEHLGREVGQGAADNGASSTACASPKSSSFGAPSAVNPMLLGLMSPCRNPFACRAARASARVATTDTASAGAMGLSRSRSSSVPPERYSTIRNGRPRQVSTPWIWATPGCVTVAIAQASGFRPTRRTRSAPSGS